MTTPPPIAMLAELTHRCPLSCPYCSNPAQMASVDAELQTTEWARVFNEAADLGVLQLHLSGGEPASRRDLVELVRAARDAGLALFGLGFRRRSGAPDSGPASASAEEARKRRTAGSV